MFNERYGLESAVLDGRKTMTRRAVVHPKRFRGHDDVSLEYHRRPGSDFYFDCVVLDANDHELGQLPLPYEVGDVVAIAQAYKTDEVLTFNAYNKDGSPREDGLSRHKEMLASEGYRNKMFVKAEYMPHHIRITDLWFERLQDISDEECLKEGVFLDTTASKNYHPYTFVGSKTKDGCLIGWSTPREAFAALIAKVSGPNTWQNNPWVIAYTFELVK